MPIGRPTKYNDAILEKALNYVANYEAVGDLIPTSEGLACELDIARSTIYKWADEHPDFSDALTLAQEWSQACWETKLEDMMVTRDVNAPLVKLYFANRFKWTDKGAVDESEEEKAQPLNITFEVRQAADSIEITNAKP
jgi:hypothetical protein